MSDVEKRRKAIPDIAGAVESAFLQKQKVNGSECGVAMMVVLINSHPLDSEGILKTLQANRNIIR